MGSLGPAQPIPEHKFGKIWQAMCSTLDWEAAAWLRMIIHQDYLRHIGESYGRKKSVNRSDEEKEEGFRGLAD